ncbi:uncharacterized protein LOC100844591 isoform X2 [Brachypodium distachyon]|uniref:Uncharacterized protein n=1 Tax=Brachypodium distachyon TaxID=15368 RepID=A0A2K2D594_BRADI|nr:uncharacterized protein LOC100844591 isoform X2 [Brachypodium distachyon]PNT69436.1 hypothetical protein BRADI_3g55363v3 [Brachypodium distachyon]|eukprot:XP_014756148.1 uncharacterized protein LOC100844591 isoform X2 [Brachypodium distachyon]
MGWGIQAHMAANMWCMTGCPCGVGVGVGVGREGYGTRAGFHSAQMAAERRQAELVEATDEVMRNLQKERAKTDKIMLGLLSLPFVATAGYEVMRNLEKERAKTNKDEVMNNSV